ncbi:MAG: Ig-like domain repeat protein [Clostridia bacterium]|nr:Ig-like domain repeat protein [Clostridia bacterium]
MNRIVRVYGTCDNWQVEFQNEGGDGLWTCAVPADMTDGQYACRFYAIDDDGDIGFWCGILYLSSGNVCFQLDEDPVRFTLIHETLIFTVLDERVVFELIDESPAFILADESLIFKVVKECCK